MACKIKYKNSVFHDLKKIDKSWAKRIMDRIDDELALHPEKGEAMKGEWLGFFKYRVGVYRVIFSREEDTLLILRIGHRGKIYR